jgi:DNA helicase-2/ATP-dependent DNA helicase PcrA
MSSKVRMLMDVLDDAPTAGRASTGRRRPGPAPGGRGDKRSVADLASEIEWAKSRCLRPDALVRAAAFAGRRSSWDPAEVAEIWERYEVHKRRRGVLDFEDLLARCTDQLLSDPEFAASARWRYRHLFVDEYQDVNEAQQRLLRAWLAGNDDLCVVGDPHQAIYSWNGANPKAITNFGEDFPGATVLRLSINYRSTHEVLTVAGAVLGETKAALAGGVRPEGPIPTVVSYADETAEAAGVAEGARRAKRPGRSWSQIAVLARTNAQLNTLEAALSARGVPCHVASAAGLLGKPWVQEAVRSAAWAADTPTLAAWAADLLATVRRPDDHDDEATAPNESLADDARLDLTALARMAGEYLSEDGAATGAGFQSWLQAAQGRDHDPIRRDAVSLTTFHRAKGLEWAVVFVTGLEDGYVPISHARDPDSLAEERRLLYVACTRAEEELHCSWAAERSFPTSRPIPRAPSPWLSAIEAAHRDLQRLRRAAPEAAREALAASRRVLEGA